MAKEESRLVVMIPFIYILSLSGIAKRGYYFLQPPMDYSKTTRYSKNQPVS